MSKMGTEVTANPLTPDTDSEGTFLSNTPNHPKQHRFIESSKDSLACPAGNGHIKIKVNTKHQQERTKVLGENLLPASLCRPLSSH